MKQSMLCDHTGGENRTAQVMRTFEFPISIEFSTPFTTRLPQGEL